MWLKYVLVSRVSAGGPVMRAEYSREDVVHPACLSVVRVVRRAEVKGTTLKCGDLRQDGAEVERARRRVAIVNQERDCRRLRQRGRGEDGEEDEAVEGVHFGGEEARTVRRRS
jgi:hypothetical protein